MFLFCTQYLTSVGLTHVYRYDEEAVDPPELDSTREYFVRYDLKDTHSAAPKIIVQYDSALFGMFILIVAATALSR